MTNFSAAPRQLAWLLALGMGAARAAGLPLPVLGLPAQAQSALILDGVPAADPDLNLRVSQYLVGRDAAFQAWLPDNSLLISTRFGDTAQVHRVSAPLGMREQLTWYADPISKVLTAPVGAAEGFAFLMEHNGDGMPQVYYYGFAPHTARMLSGGTGRHGSPLWSPDGKHVDVHGYRPRRRHDRLLYVRYRRTDPAASGGRRQGARLVPPGLVRRWPETAALATGQRRRQRAVHRRCEHRRRTARRGRGPASGYPSRTLRRRRPRRLHQFSGWR